MTFTQWHDAAWASPLCVGIDPHPEQIAQWGLPDSPDSLSTFSNNVLSAAAGRARFIKPQSAFFERHGSAGIAVLEDLLAQAREAGLLSILDAKRGDIGSTMAGYADAYLNPARPLAADALTVSPYLGVGSLRPAMEAAAEHSKGLFVLALTSNPEGREVQHARTPEGRAVAAEVVRQAEEVNRQLDVPLIGLVVGATIGTAAADLGIDLGEFSGPVLSPGFGSQGAGTADLEAVFGEAYRAGRVIVNASRSLSRCGPDSADIAEEIASIAEAVTPKGR